MLSINKQFATDDDKLENGVESYFEGGAVLWLRPATSRNKQFAAGLRRIAKRFRSEIGRGMDIDKVPEMHEAYAGLLARTIVTKWEGVKGDDGAEVPYSAQACKAALMEPEHNSGIELIEEIMKRAGQKERFRLDSDEDEGTEGDEKNL